MNTTSSAWRKSTYSLPQDNCVEVGATGRGLTTVRDTQDREGPQLAFAGQDWNRFLTRVRTAEV